MYQNLCIDDKHIIVSSEYLSPITKRIEINEIILQNVFSNTKVQTIYKNVLSGFHNKPLLLS